LQNELANILANFNWTASITKYNFQVIDPATPIIGWAGNLTLSGLNFSTPIITLNGNTTNSTISSAGIVLTQAPNQAVFSVTTNVSYYVKSSATGSNTGTGNLTYTFTTFTLTKVENNGIITATLVVNLTNTTVMLAGYPSDSYAPGYLQQLIGNYTQAFATQSADLQAAVNAYYLANPWPATFPINTTNPDIVYNYNLSWTNAAPIYNATGAYYSISGSINPPPAPTPNTTEAKVARFLSKLVEEKLASGAWTAPTVDPTQGGKQIFFSTQSLVGDITNGTTANGTFTFAVTNLNKLSSLFTVSVDSLARVYPGIMTAYPRDASVSINAKVTHIDVNPDFSLNFVIAFNVIDAKSASVLAWNTFFHANATVTSNPTLQFSTKNIIQEYSSITTSPYGFVDGSTLESWIDDAFTLYNAAPSWSLYKTPLNFNSFIGAISNTTVDSNSVFYAGN
jgi:hypothetical protein